MDFEDLSRPQVAVIAEISEEHASVMELRRAFFDPGEAFVCSPVSLSLRTLARIYEDTVEENERHLFISELRKRRRDERWTEKRAVFQARRTAARKDALIESEAQVWAVLGLEFHQRRLRGLIDRWEALEGYVMANLERCERGDRVYGTDLRDACKELVTIEQSLVEIMPTMGIPARAQQYWSDKAGSRKEMIGRISDKMQSVVGGSRANAVFEIIQGGNTEDD